MVLSSVNRRHIYILVNLTIIDEESSEAKKVIAISNPWNEKRRILAQSIGKRTMTETESREMDELEAKSRELIQQKIREFTSEVDRIEEQAVDIKNLPKLSKQYNELKALHKRAKSIANLIGKMKIDVLHEWRPPKEGGDLNG